MHFEVNMLQNVRKNIFTDTQTTNSYHRCFEMVMSLRKAKYCVFGLSQERSKRHCMYLGFQSLKISSKKGEKLLENSKQIRNDVFQS